jgi:hypothetical protein
MFREYGYTYAVILLFFLFFFSSTPGLHTLVDGWIINDSPVPSTNFDKRPRMIRACSNPDDLCFESIFLVSV